MTEQMIDQLQSDSRQAVQVMEHGRQEARHSVDLAAKTRAALDAISKMIDRITEMNHQIATASEEQTLVAEEINQDVAKRQSGCRAARAGGTQQR